jgi:hypothetical protein
MNWSTPDEWRVAHIATHLRAQDVAEVFYSDAKRPEEAVYDSWKNSPDCRCIDGDDGTPVGICGVASGGVIWLLATEELLATSSHRRQFIRGAKQWVDGLLNEGSGPLHNWVFAANRDSIRWLKKLGFQFWPAEPYGPCGQLFRYFERSV